ncbi:MAG: zinc metalloprotease HtpX [Myxococcota bacterium]
MKNQLKTLALLGGLTALFVGIGGAIGPTYLYGALFFALLMNVGAYFYSDQIVLRMNGARIVDRSSAPDLYGMVEELATKAELPTPKVAIIEDPAPNAFATGRNPEKGVVAVTTGILRILDRRELRGVIAHELGHIKNRDILLQSVAAVIASSISGVANLLMWLPLFGGSDDEDAPNPLAALALAFVAPMAATLIQFGISRSREFLADETGARIAGDPEALASALMKLERGVQAMPSPAQPATASMFIVNPFGGTDAPHASFGGGGVSKWFSTHPSTTERVQRLRALRA